MADPAGTEVGVGAIRARLDAYRRWVYTTVDGKQVGRLVCAREDVGQLLAIAEAAERLRELLHYEPHQRDGNFVDFTFHVDTLAEFADALDAALVSLGVSAVAV